MRFTGRRKLWSGAVLGAAMLLTPRVGVVQTTSDTPQQPTVGQPPTHPGMDVPPNPALDAERAKMLNDDRHKRLTDDVNKLVTLTNELKTDVDKTGKDELSLQVMRKAAEIEKLAHDVQSRMKN
jgi:hypothetical protein